MRDPLVVVAGIEVRFLRRPLIEFEQMSKPKLPPGVAKGDYVPLTSAKFGQAYATLIGVTAGTEPSAPDFSTEIYDARTQRAQPLADTPFNRGWFTAGKLFGDHAERLSFYWRV